MTIKEVEKKLNITRANIRYYEKEGLLEPKRNENEYRNFSNHDIKRLEQILLFRKCNVSIEDIRLIFNGSKKIDDVFKNQITKIENEMKQLEGAKIMCKKLAQEKSTIDKIDTEKYINIMNKEENKGNNFYNITEDYILASEKLYQSIIENKEFKGGEKMKKGIKIGIYIASFALTTIILGLLDYFFNKNINWEEAICFAGILTVVDIIGTKKYIETKSGKKFSKKDNINHFIITSIIMVISLFSYLTIKSVISINKEPNENILELSVQKSLIEIAQEKYPNSNDNLYAESHKLIDYEIKDNKIYAYVATNYGLINKDNCEMVNNTENIFTMIYNKSKNKEGIYELKEYKENNLPDKLKEKANVNYEDKYFQNQLNNYCIK